ncbi:hypothetical protein KC363_g9011 [Hortaea werneckii]|nr:hypothetical protein KC361_g9099 [Hortaea werneckii]KAI6877766.1 hypothetical protein KC325_g9047 [Hortaea werneckii]KAI6985946.1 hypothetical protein KC359_g8956 [Hortaea werneckii]KAI7139958.1 hypothetical protein KC344_g9044 [Hortaea werneckii]KAI7166738.1 hypothetical protein KC360_g9049 [Hortaea werneckii]
MADQQLQNGTPSTNMDVEMKEEHAPATNMNNIAEANPPAQPAASAQPEQLSSIRPAQPPAAQTPPTTSGASARPSSMPPQPSTRPEKPVAHGGPTRQYLNSNITPHLLEGMKHLAMYEPEKPLLWLADFLRERSKEVEGQ